MTPSVNRLHCPSCSGTATASSTPAQLKRTTATPPDVVGLATGAVVSVGGLVVPPGVGALAVLPQAASNPVAASPPAPMPQARSNVRRWRRLPSRFADGPSCRTAMSPRSFSPLLAPKLVRCGQLLHPFVPDCRGVGHDKPCRNHDLGLADALLIYLCDKPRNRALSEDVER
jgi:hypothetical protein